MYIYDSVPSCKMRPRSCYLGCKIALGMLQAEYGNFKSR